MREYMGQLREYADTLPVIDTHTHLWMKETLYDRNQDFLVNLLTQYYMDDLHSAGMTSAEHDFICDTGNDVVDRFGVAAKYMRRSFNTGYARLIRRILKLFYGVEQLTEDNVASIAETYRQRMRVPGFYHRILREDCHIEKIVSDHSHYEGIDFQYDSDLFAPVVRMDHLIHPRDTDDLRRVERECGFPINSFDDMIEAVGAVLDCAVQNGAIGIKSGLAYERSLHYDFPDYGEARKGFEGIRASRVSLYEDIQVPLTISKACQDYIMHEVLRYANRRGMLFQFHTGYQVGYGNDQNRINPLLLNNLFIEYRNIRFHIFHAGYPYFYQLGALAKQFPNVYPDLCWAHIIDPAAARTALRAWLGSVPVCKILGFGSDVHGVEAVKAHLSIAKDNICQALSDAMDTGDYDIVDCKQILRSVLYDNPREILRL